MDCAALHLWVVGWGAWASGICAAEVCMAQCVGVLQAVLWTGSSGLWFRPLIYTDSSPRQGRVFLTLALPIFLVFVRHLGVY